jgi:hypothetical protein
MRKGIACGARIFRGRHTAFEEAARKRIGS